MDEDEHDSACDHQQSAQRMKGGVDGGKARGVRCVILLLVTRGDEETLRVVEKDLVVVVQQHLRLQQTPVLVLPVEHIRSMVD